ncbi:MAG: glycosyltransferase [Bacteroidetes bacterium]|nr:MAG: glycosyltransferase [Bacteroidota bacterium]
MYNLSVIIPFLNESGNIERLTTELDTFFSKKMDLKVEVIFVDDGSTDNSLELLQQARYTHYTPKVIKLSKNYGSHAALRAGILHAEGAYISFMYADLQDPLELITQMYALAQERHEIVWAVRKTTQSGFSERLFSQTYSYLMKKYAIKNFPAKGFDIVMFGQKVRRELNQNIELNSSIFLQILTMGFQQTTIEYDKQARQAGKSKWTFSKKVKLFVDSFIAFSFAPIRFVTFVGILLFILGSLYGAYIVGRKLIYNDLEQGWASLIAILMVGFGITNISLGIIAEYLWRTLDASRKRPLFIIDDIISPKN